MRLKVPPGFTSSSFFTDYVPLDNWAYAHRSRVSPTMIAWEQKYDSREKLSGDLIDHIKPYIERNEPFPIHFFFARHVAVQQNELPITEHERAKAEGLVRVADDIYGRHSSGKVRFVL